MQSHSGILYFATNKGVLQYDGARWQNIDVANYSDIRYIAQAKDSTIYIAADNDFGFLKTDSTGHMIYESLAPTVRETLGEFGVLSGHTPFLTSLKPGKINYKDSAGKEKVIFVSGGFSEALPDRVTILAESAERRRDIDVDRARAALERAQKRLAEEKAETKESAFQQAERQQVEEETRVAKESDKGFRN